MLRRSFTSYLRVDAAADLIFRHQKNTSPINGNLVISVATKIIPRPLSALILDTIYEQAAGLVRQREQASRPGHAKQSYTI